MRILVLRGGALGDFVVTLPALGLLRARWPQARIELVGNPSAAALGLQRHYLDAVHDRGESRWRHLGGGGFDPHSELGAWLASFNLVVSFWPDADGAIAADFAALGFRAPSEKTKLDAGGRVFLAHPPLPTIAPTAAHFCAALAPLGLAAQDFRSRLFPSATDRAAAAHHVPEADGAPLIALHPGSGARDKCWPLERWAEVLTHLHATAGARTCVILGEAEESWWPAASAKVTLPADVRVLPGLKPRELAALFSHCSLFLGHDSGPSHIAAAVGCACVLVFGPTDPAMWAPPGEHVRALRRGTATDAVGVADVLAAVARYSGGDSSKTKRHGFAAHSGPA